VPRTCSICSHEHRDAMEDAFIVGQAKRRIASQHGVSERAVRYHMREHLPALLALARDAERAARADTLLDRMEALQSQTLAILDAPEDQRTALAAIAQARRNLELIAEITEQLDRRGTVNLELSVEWQEVKAVLVNTLASYPEAQQAVFNALEEAPSGN
jgi:recombinational DNA repair protein RecR